MPFKQNKIHYTFKEFVLLILEQNNSPTSVIKGLNNDRLKYFVYPVVGHIKLEKLSQYHIRKLFLYWQSNLVTFIERKFLIMILDYIFNYGIELKIILINQFSEALKKYNPYENNSYLSFFEFRERKDLQKLNYELLYSNNESLFNKPNLIKKHESFSIELYKYIYPIINKKYNSLNNDKLLNNNVLFIDAFNEYIDLEFRVGKAYKNNHINLFLLYVFPALKNKYLIEVNEIDIKVFEIILYLRTIEEYMISFYHSVFNKFFIYCIKNGYCNNNPCDYLNKFDNKNIIYKTRINELNNRNKAIKEKDTLNKEEIEFILNYIKGSKFEPIIGLLIIYGFRIGEVLGLKIDSIDFDKGIITIDSQVSNGVFLDHTKTYKIRKVIISKVALYYLDILIRRNKEYKDNNPLYNNKYNLLITDEDGNVLPFTSLVNYLKEIGKLINKPYLSFHTFRHTFVTIASELNASLIKTKEEIGHSSIMTTMNTYIHSTKDSNIITQKKVNEYLTNLIYDYNINDNHINDYYNFVIKEQNNISFEYLSNKYLINLKQEEGEDAYKALRKAIKPYLDYFGSKEIKSITRIDILKANKDFFDKNIKNKTINYRLWGLRKFFEKIKDDGLVINNPVEEIDLLKNKIFYKPYYKDNEIKEILLNSEISKYGNAYALSLSSGLDAKYILALNIEDVILETSYLRINKYIEREKRENIVTKYLNKEIYYYINEISLYYIRKEIDKLKEKIEVNNDTPIFINQNKSRASIDNFRDVFKRYSEKININYYPIDTLTYTFGVIAYKSDAPVSEVLKHVGKIKGKIIYENKNMYEKFKEKEVNINDYFDNLFNNSKK